MFLLLGIAATFWRVRLTWIDRVQALLLGHSPSREKWRIIPSPRRHSQCSLAIIILKQNRRGAFGTIFKGKE